MSMLGVQISLSAGGVCVPDVPIDHGWARLAEGKWVKRERPVHCVVRWIFKDSWQRQRRKKMPAQNFTVSSLILSFPLFSPSRILLFRKYGLNEIHWLPLVWSPLPRKQLSGWGVLGHPCWDPKCIKHNPEQIMCKRKTTPKQTQTRAVQWGRMGVHSNGPAAQVYLLSCVCFLKLMGIKEMPTHTSGSAEDYMQL